MICWVRPTAPTPITLPASSVSGDTLDTTTSATRVDFPRARRAAPPGRTGSSTCRAGTRRPPNATFARREASLPRPCSVSRSLEHETRPRERIDQRRIQVRLLEALCERRLTQRGLEVGACHRRRSPCVRHSGRARHEAYARRARVAIDLLRDDGLRRETFRRGDTLGRRDPNVDRVRGVRPRAGGSSDARSRAPSPAPVASITMRLAGSARRF